VAHLFLDLGMHRGPLLGYLTADPELSLQSMLMVAAVIGRLKAFACVGLVALPGLAMWATRAALRLRGLAVLARCRKGQARSPSDRRRHLRPGPSGKCLELRAGQPAATSPRVLSAPTLNRVRNAMGAEPALRACPQAAQLSCRP